MIFNAKLVRSGIGRLDKIPEFSNIHQTYAHTHTHTHKQRLQSQKQSERKKKEVSTSPTHPFATQHSYTSTFRSLP